MLVEQWNVWMYIKDWGELPIWSGLLLHNWSPVRILRTIWHLRLKYLKEYRSFLYTSTHSIAQPAYFPKDHKTKALKVTLNTMLDTEESVVDAGKKTCRMLFYIRWQFVAPTLSIFLFFSSTPSMRKHVKRFKSLLRTATIFPVKQTVFRRSAMGFTATYLRHANDGIQHLCGPVLKQITARCYHRLICKFPQSTRRCKPAILISLFKRP